LRTALGRLTLSELFGNRTSVSKNVETSLNQFFEENHSCAELKRFELTEIIPLGIDLTKESIAQREKIRQIIISEAEKYNQQKISEANYYKQEQLANARKYKLSKMGDADMTVIMKRAEAERKSMELLSEAINSNGGQDIVKIKMAQQYLEQMKNIYSSTKCTIAPKESTNFATLLTMLNNNKTV